MRTVYATQFQIEPNDGRGGTEVLLDVQSRVTKWVSDKYDRAWRHPVTIAFDGEPSVPIAGHLLRGRLLSAGDTDLLTLDWSHPHDHDPSLEWITNVVAGRQTNQVAVAAMIRIATVQMSLRPIGFDLGRPGVVSGLLSDFRTSIDGWSIPSAGRCCSPLMWTVL